MFLIELDQSSEGPLYHQIAHQIRTQIRRGLLPPGTKLPPTRTLAARLGTHRNTVVRAFDELAQAGLIESTVGRGSFVSKRGSEKADPSPQPRMQARLTWSTLLSRRSETVEAARMTRLRRIPAAGRFINLQRMQPSTDLLPVEDFRRCMQHVLRSSKGRALGYAPIEGHEPLREAIARELASSGILAQPSDILITSGSQQGLDLLARVLLDPGDPLLVESATYSGAIPLFAGHGAALVGIRTDDEGPLMTDLEGLGGRAPKALYVMPNGRNPTGGVMSASRRKDLIDWSHRTGVALIEDDFCADLDLDGVRPPPALRAMDADVIYVSTFSKKLIPALRLGFAVCPRPVLERMVLHKHASDLGASLLMQVALAEFLERGYLKAHLRRVVAAYRARRDAAQHALARFMAPDIRTTPITRGVTIWLELPAELDAEAIFEEALAHGVLVSPGTLSSVGEGPNGIRLTLCGEPPDRIEQGVRRLARAIEDVRSRGTTRPSSPAIAVV